MKNEYGLDISYTRGKLDLVLRDLDRYTPSELARELGRICGDKRVDQLESAIAVYKSEFKTVEKSIKKARKQRDRARARLQEFETIIGTVTGKGYQVSGYHLNGDLVDLDYLLEREPFTLPETTEEAAQ